MFLCYTSDSGPNPATLAPTFATKKFDSTKRCWNQAHRLQNSIGRPMKHFEYGGSKDIKLRGFVSSSLRFHRKDGLTKRVHFEAKAGRSTDTMVTASLHLKRMCWNEPGKAK